MPNNILFVVDDYTDQIKERERGKVDLENLERDKWKWEPLQAFSDRDDACAAILGRAEHALLKAIQEVDRQRARLRKCQKKFGRPGDTRSPVPDNNLRAFYRDEMSTCVDIGTLRKLALCRMGDPRYKDYRKKYFDGKENV